MARSEAQKRADKKYFEKTKGKYLAFKTYLNQEDFAQIDGYIKSKNISKAEFLRKAYEVLKNSEQ